MIGGGETSDIFLIGCVKESVGWLSRSGGSLRLPQLTKLIVKISAINVESAARAVPRQLMLNTQAILRSESDWNF